jgi:hypothetical protein
MPILVLITILCLGLMIANELAVLLFVNPALWRMDQSPQAQATPGQALICDSGSKTV